MPPVDPRSVPPGAYGNWPGLNQTGRLRVDRARLRAIAKRLESDLEEIIQATEDLQRAVGTPHAAYGTWDAAQNLVPSIVKCRAVLTEQHGAFLAEALNTIKLLRRTAQVYDDAESELERRVAAVRIKLENTPDPTAPRTTDSPRPGPGSLR
ncbi:WXG100 family type VII secretion target [Actinomadura nitritigenes]|jgi:hypothetical protein|uniref:WXG100 family type VII secretion target n=1 Tax=Actinomadura TaxID=1988 RepID=UPI0016856B21|nr:hypothetical protein [Actinomadura sp. RB99]MBD2896915.1 hypothetical protein [Actinomadura sp. RB99]